MRDPALPAADRGRRVAARVAGRRCREQPVRRPPARRLLHAGRPARDRRLRGRSGTSRWCRRSTCPGTRRPRSPPTRELGNDRPQSRSGAHRAGASPAHVLNVDDATLRVLPRRARRGHGRLPRPATSHIGGDECPTAEWQASAAPSSACARSASRTRGQLQGWFISADDRAPRAPAAAAWSAGTRCSSRRARRTRSSWPGAATSPAWYAAADRPPGRDGARVLDVFRLGARRTRRSPRDPRRNHVAASTPSTRPPRPARRRPRGHHRRASQLWTEYVPGPEQAEYMYFPRLCAFAESAWSRPGGDYGEFAARLTGTWSGRTRSG